MNQNTDIKKVKLYFQIDRIYNELRELGIQPLQQQQQHQQQHLQQQQQQQQQHQQQHLQQQQQQHTQITTDAFSHFDQFHYDGTTTVKEAITKCQISSKSNVLDIGSGLGGPARYLSSRTGCFVTALELQPELNEIARQLTNLCGLSHRIRHICGDVLLHDFAHHQNNNHTNKNLEQSLGGSGLIDETDNRLSTSTSTSTSTPTSTSTSTPTPTPTPTQYEAIVSWLAFLHIPDRNLLFKQCWKVLKEDGFFYVDDYFQKGNGFSEEEWRQLREDIYCHYLPSFDEYRSQLESQGFVVLEMIDLTEKWRVFVSDRLISFRENRQRHVRVHGQQIVDTLDLFYNIVHQLFASGNLGGLRLLAKKPSNNRANQTHL